jgi:hypothetical protein
MNIFNGDGSSLVESNSGVGLLTGAEIVRGLRIHHKELAAERDLPVVVCTYVHTYNT